jgi:hypothetical protein
VSSPFGIVAVEIPVVLTGGSGIQVVDFTIQFTDGDLSVPTTPAQFLPSRTTMSFQIRRQPKLWKLSLGLAVDARCHACRRHLDAFGDQSVRSPLARAKLWFTIPDGADLTRD